MDADWSVELGHDDPTLEFPWSSPDGSRHYFDLSSQPERITEILEAGQYPELAELLRAINGAQSHWLTVKCDVWNAPDLNEAEAIYDATIKFCSYVDLVARDTPARFSFERHEQWVKSAARTLSTDDDIPIACEFIVRRCWYHPDQHAGQNAIVQPAAPGTPAPGFYVTYYLFGYGADEAQARKHWAAGLRHATSLLSGLAP